MDAPSALRIRLSTEARVHAAIDRPIDRVAQDRAFARRVAIARDQDPRLSRQPLHRVFRAREIEDRDPSHAKDAVVQFGLVPDFEDGSSREITPLGFGEFAGGDAAVRDYVAVRPLARDRLALEGYRV